MSKKEFWVEVSFSGRVKMSLEADSQEEAKSIVFETISANFSSDNSDVSIEEVEWEFISKEPQGNIRTAYVEDIYIEEQ